MLRKYYPSQYMESVFAIDFAKLHQMGYRGIIFDVDNTLVHHGEDSTPQVDTLFSEIQAMGFRTVILSNNGPSRLERFLRNIDCPYIDNANKPQPEGYLRAMEVLELPKEQVLFIGDQVFSDILGANRSGIDSILVRYLRHDEHERIGIKRTLEKGILWFYFHSSRKNRLGNISKEQ